MARSAAGAWREDEIELVRELADRTHLRIERAHAEDALRKFEARLQALIDNLPGCAVHVVDRSLCYLVARGEALSQAGLKPADFLGRSIFQALPEALAAPYEPLFRQALAGEPFEHEHVAHERDYLTRGVPLHSSSDDIYAVLAASVDITDCKRVEAGSREADKRKDEFLAMLAHELRNPLTAITNATHVMRHLTCNDATVQRPRDIIERQTQHLTRLVDDLLDMSRLTWGKINLEREPLPLHGVLQRAIEINRPLLDARRHRLRVTLPPMAVQVDGDSTRLAQVFGNIFHNVAKYKNTGGHIELHTTTTADEVIVRVRVRVRDNGSGLSEALLPRVFDLFTQGGRSIDRAQGGLGIGLALVRSLVNMHGGEVQAHSAEPGQGSEFVVRLPVERSSPDPDPRLHQPAAAGGLAQARAVAARLKVLVVKDNADAAEMLVLLLQQDGDEVRLAPDGLTALDEARDFRPHVVLCDLGLPQMNGYEFAERARKPPGRGETLLIALSGYGREEDRRSSVAGFDYHLTKPVDPAVLAGLLQIRRGTAGAA